MRPSLALPAGCEKPIGALSLNLDRCALPVVPHLPRPRAGAPGIFTYGIGRGTEGLTL